METNESEKSAMKDSNCMQWKTANGFQTVKSSVSETMYFGILWNQKSQKYPILNNRINSNSISFCKSLKQNKMANNYKS